MKITFLTKAYYPWAESLTNYEGDPNEIGELLRANSEFFIGPNTREQMRSLQKLHETDAGFVLSPMIVGSLWCVILPIYQIVPHYK
jgi:hypothetical protein